MVISNVLMHSESSELCRKEEERERIIPADVTNLASTPAGFEHSEFGWSQI